MSEKTDPQQDLPNELAHKLSQWHQANPKATLTEIEAAVEAELAIMRKQLVEKLAHETMGEQKVPDCPQCGQKMVKNGQRKRKLKGKEGQTIQLNRQQWRCLSCGTTLFPPG